jgi:ParB-like chromosome segregation protein Spo0J
MNSVGLDLMGSLTGCEVDPSESRAIEESEQRRRATVPIESLLPGESPRSAGIDQSHVMQLVEIESPLPPILVERHTMRVIDGMHRLLAALVKGNSEIEVEFFDGGVEDAFLLAVEANVVHGLPLSQLDRRLAATRIIDSHPHMSDRAIARAVGLGAKAVAGIRRSSSGPGMQVDARVGRDGRLRPLSSDEGRRRAAEVLTERPEASLREVARLAGISPATVSDVKKKLEAGEEPTVSYSPPAKNSAGTPEPSEADPAGKNLERVPTVARSHRIPAATVTDPALELDKLMRDPSLRFKQEGRHLLRLLQQNTMSQEDWIELTEVVPPHCGALIVDLARQFAQTWMGFAQELDERFRAAPQS